MISMNIKKKYLIYITLSNLLDGSINNKNEKKRRFNYLDYLFSEQ